MKLDAGFVYVCVSGWGRLLRRRRINRKGRSIRVSRTVNRRSRKSNREKLSHFPPPRLHFGVKRIRRTESASREIGASSFISLSERWREDWRWMRIFHSARFLLQIVSRGSAVFFLPTAEKSSRYGAYPPQTCGGFLRCSFSTEISRTMEETSTCRGEGRKLALIDCRYEGKIARLEHVLIG